MFHLKTTRDHAKIFLSSSSSSSSKRYFKGSNKSQDNLREDGEGSHGTSGHIYNRITFSWFNKIIQLGNRKPLSLEDFDPMPYELTARPLQNQMNVLLAEEKVILT